MRVVGDDGHAAIQSACGVEGWRNHEVHHKRTELGVRDFDLEIDGLTGEYPCRRGYDRRESLFSDDLAQMFPHQLLGLSAKAGRVFLVGPDEADVPIVTSYQGGRCVDDDLQVLTCLPELHLTDKPIPL